MKVSAAMTKSLVAFSGFVFSWQPRKVARKNVATPSPSSRPRWSSETMA
jgi:hypothetical protein